MHLLRLRPTPKQLQEWNGDRTEPNRQHLPCGWTDFIEKLTPLSLLQDVDGEPQQKIVRRPHVIRDLFMIAKMEEDYLNDARGKHAEWCWNDV